MNKVAKITTLKLPKNLANQTTKNVSINSSKWLPNVSKKNAMQPLSKIANVRPDARNGDQKRNKAKTTDHGHYKYADSNFHFLLFSHQTGICLVVICSSRFGS